MRTITKRTVTFSAAIATFALVGTGCHTTKSSETTTSATTSVTASATTGTATTTPSAAASTTQMTGANGAVYAVQGPILDKYNSLDEKARKDLGAPTGNQQTNPDGGVYQQFDGGVIINKTQAYVVWGKIRDKWNELGGSQGKLGYPTSDEVDTPDGMKKSTFEHGTITWKPGDAQATVTYS
ncbi:MAG TPA: hypothetical protein VLL82_12520 [Mycobacterium sp.]|nr:hypothetical protein [Mycobacterium sp.]